MKKLPLADIIGIPQHLFSMCGNNLIAQIHVDDFHVRGNLAVFKFRLSIDPKYHPQIKHIAGSTNDYRLKTPKSQTGNPLATPVEYNITQIPFNKIHLIEWRPAQLLQITLPLDDDWNVCVTGKVIRGAARQLNNYFNYAVIGLKHTTVEQMA